jgi:hypothetical protein
MISPRNGEQLLERVLHLFFCRLYNKLYWCELLPGESEALSGQIGQIHTAEFRFAIVLFKKIHYIKYT